MAGAGSSSWLVKSVRVQLGRTAVLTQNVFSQEGLATIVVAAGAYLFVYNYPDTAGFLTETERAVIHARLSADSDCTHDERFTWANVMRAIKDPKCWLYGFAFHTMSLPLYTFSLFVVRYITKSSSC